MKSPASPFSLVCIATAVLIASCGQRPIPTPDVPEPEYSQSQLDSLIETDSEVINEATKKNASVDPTPFLDSGEQPWGLRAILTDLSVSVSGTFGPLIMKGTPAVTLVWSKKDRAASAMPLIENSESWEEKLKSQPEFTDPTLQKSLLEHLDRFRKLVKGIEAAPHRGGWWPSRLRLDLGVDVSGKLTPVATIGGDVRVRLEWHRAMKKQSALVLLSSSDALTRLEANMLRFVENLSADLETLVDSKKAEKLGNYRAQQYRLGFGVTETLSIGAAKSVYSTYGHVYFTRANKPATFADEKIVTPSEDDSYTLLDAQNPSATSAFAAPKRDEYKINRRAFRRGLEHAMTIGRFISRSADKVSGRKWRIKEMKTGFDLTLTGSSKLAHITGVGASEITFVNLNF